MEDSLSLMLQEKPLFSTREQELLLRAALLAGPAALDAWEQWKANTDFGDYLDNGSFRLLPLLYKNLRRHGVTDPFMHKLKGIYRLAWYKNQTRFRDIEEVLRTFHEAGIQTMLLKGAALTLLHYKDNGVRPMVDVDILVSSAKARLDAELLTKSGWTPTTKPLEAHLRYRHSLLFTDKFRRDVDLHWHVLSECCQKDADKDFWKDAVSISIDNVPTYALNPTDTLLHVIIQGVKWNPEPSIRWIADAMTVLNSANSEIDWLRLINQAQKRRVGFPLKMGLKFLHDTFHLCIPRTIMNDVNNIPVSFLERIESRYHTSDREIRENALLGGFPICLVEYLRKANGIGAFRAVVELPKYLQYRLQTKHIRGLVFSLMSKSLRGIRKVICQRWLNQNVSS
jgi:hypothetical protein